LLPSVGKPDSSFSREITKWEVRGYLIAYVDIAALTGARTVYEGLLPEYFPIWEDISGVLAFEFSSDFVSKVFWTWQFFRNPTAKNPISDACAQVLKPGAWNTEVPLYLDSADQP